MNGQRYFFAVSRGIRLQIFGDLITGSLQMMRQMVGLIHIRTSIGRPVDTTNVTGGCFSNGKYKVEPFTK
jgi:hypothetical protein